MHEETAGVGASRTAANGVLPNSCLPSLAGNIVSPVSGPRLADFRA